MLVKRDHRIADQPSVLSTWGICRGSRAWWRSQSAKATWRANNSSGSPRRRSRSRWACSPTSSRQTAMSTSGADGAPAPHPAPRDRPPAAGAALLRRVAFARSTASSAIRCRHSSVGGSGSHRGGAARRPSRPARVGGDRLPDRRLACAARAGDQKQHGIHHRGARNRFSAASGAHPVVSRCADGVRFPRRPRSRRTVACGKLPSTRCGWTCRGPLTTPSRVRSPPTCWWWARATRVCGRHCMPHSAIRTRRSFWSMPNASDGRRRAATAASSTPA